MTPEDDLLMRRVARRRRLRDLNTRIYHLEVFDQAPNECFVLPPVAAFKWQRGPINPPLVMRERAMLERWRGVMTRATRLAEEAVDDACLPHATAVDRLIAYDLLSVLGYLADYLETP